MTLTDRAAAVQLARTGALLGPTEMGLIFGVGYSAFYKNQKRGLYDDFKTTPPLGPRCYSGTLVARFLDGEDIARAPRSFGRGSRSSRRAS